MLLRAGFSFCLPPTEACPEAIDNACEECSLRRPCPEVFAGVPPAPAYLETWLSDQDVGPPAQIVLHLPGPGLQAWLYTGSPTVQNEEAPTSRGRNQPPVTSTAEAVGR